MKAIDLKKKKETQQKIVMVTCYDYSSAVILANSTADVLLVGDSVACVVHGYANTLGATVEMMETHTKAVAKGANKKPIITDMPFLATRKGLVYTMQTVEKLTQAGAEAIKIESADGNLECIEYIIQSGVPVMGHLGLTPQFVNLFGGHKVQGRGAEQQKKIMADALAMQAAGCFALLLECIPYQLAKGITEALKIPTIGIGASRYTDGQVLVLNDLLGLNNQFNPTFVKKYLQGSDLITAAVNAFAEEVRSLKFPSDEHHYE